MACGGLARAVSLRFVPRIGVNRDCGPRRCRLRGLMSRARAKSVSVTSEKHHETLSPLPPPKRDGQHHSCAHPAAHVEVLAHRRQGVKEKVNAQRTHNATPRHAGLAGAGWSRTPHVAGRSSTYELARIADEIKTILLVTITIAIKTQYYSPLHGARPSTLLAMCMWCDLVSVVCLSVCLF